MRNARVVPAGSARRHRGAPWWDHVNSFNWPKTVQRPNPYSSAEDAVITYRPSRSIRRWRRVTIDYAGRLLYPYDPKGVYVSKTTLGLRYNYFSASELLPEHLKVSEGL